MSGLYVGKVIPALLFGKAVHAVVVEVDDYGNRIALSVLPPGLDSPKTVFTCRFSKEPTDAFVDGVANPGTPGGRLGAANLESWVTRHGDPFGSWYENNAMVRPDFVPGGIVGKDEVESKP